MAGKGGARPGAGRKPDAKIYSAELTKAKEHLAFEMREAVKALISIALGKCFEEKWVPAGTVLKKDVLRISQTTADPEPWREKPDSDDDSPLADGIWRDDKGKPVVVDVPVFPELSPETLVLIERKPIRPDVKALMYWWNRLEGVPRQSPEEEAERLDIRAAVTAAHEVLAARRAEALEKPAEPEDVPDAIEPE